MMWRLGPSCRRGGQRRNSELRALQDRQAGARPLGSVRVARLDGCLCSRRRHLLLACLLAQLLLSESNTRELGLHKHHHKPPGQGAGPGANAQLALTPLPPCALVYFVHVHKTGGTTIRDWIEKGQFGEWKSYGWDHNMKQLNGFCTGFHCNKGVSDLVDLAKREPEQYAAVHGRVFIEDHGAVHDVRSALREVRSLRNHSGWVDFGCKALTFTVMREPENYLISLARSHFKYCPFFDLLQRRNGPIQIDDPKWRYDLIHNVSHYLDNIQVRQLGMWCSSFYDQYPAHSHGPLTVKWYDDPVDPDTVTRVYDMVMNHFDVVGLTHKIPQLLLMLSDRAGFQHIKEEPTNVHPGLHDTFKGREWYQDEMDMLVKVAAQSHVDHALFTIMQHRFEQQLKKVPRLAERLALVKTGAVTR